MDRFELLLDSYLDGAAPAETAELERLLHANPSLRRQFADRLLLEIHLRKAFASAARPLPSEPKTPFRFARWLVAALVFLAVGLGLLVIWNRGPGPAPRLNQVLAGEVRLDGVVVQKLPDEKWLEVGPDAPALIQLADGSQAEIAPASRTRLHGPSQALREGVEIERGGGKFKVPPGGGLFRVDTPLGTVSVLGTEFSVKLETRSRRGGKGKASLSVAVSEGSVRVESAGKSYVLAAGERRSFPEGGRREDDDD